MARDALEMAPPQIPPSQYIATAGNAAAPSPVLSEFLGGVSLFSSNGTYNLVSTHIHLPDIHPPPDHAPISAAYVWTGIDGIGCGVATLQVGLRLAAAENFASYDAWYRWYPGPLVIMEGLSLHPGDDLQLTLLLANSSTGIVQVINYSSHESNFATISGPPLCQQSVGWMVERLSSSGGLLPLPDFGRLNFTEAFARTANASIMDPSSPTSEIYDVVQNGMVVTETAAGFMNVSIVYTGSQ